MPHRGAGLDRGVKPRVLLVEDEDVIAMMIEDLLVALGYEVVCSAPTLEQGLKAAERGDFDVALLDVNLRGERSFPIAEICASREIPFLFATGYGSLVTESRFPDALVLQKPYSMELLDSKIKTALSDTGRETRPLPSHP